ncbi:MAG TPA: radical SAM protein [Candidatus Avalokitesvara rifleensis]|uniref:radical SAM protein n=1 Tax=Candidatus Avalokitesvara rifleensis TaxID=3367620 RepID=UPI002712AA8E|nr:radical SAM protein [Candidatus Brocadiales bacterium]
MFDNIVYFGILIKGKVLRKNIPLTLSVSVTGGCNFKCSYCYGAFGVGKKHDDLTTDEWFSLIEEAAQMGTKSIYLIGGEPLLRDDIENIVDKVKEKNIICSLNSNGSLIEKKIDVIKKLDNIIISWDGMEDANDKNRGVGTYKLIWRGINCLRENKIPFSLVCVLTKNNIDQVENMLQISKEIGSSISFNLPYEQNIGNNRETRLSNQEIANTLKLLIQYKNRNLPLSQSNATQRYALNWPFDYSRKILYGEIPGDFEYVPCYTGKFICHIESNGLVYPCSQLINNFPALDFRDGGFKKAWENVLDKKKCVTCYSLCHNEQNLFFHLHPNVIINTIKRKLIR